jgi:serine/threonine protein kinase
MLFASSQVLHSDLKVRNVLLKSDGSSERGCVAKVADFGLAVKLELNHTHVSAFQVRQFDKQISKVFEK